MRSPDEDRDPSARRRVRLRMSYVSTGSNPELLRHYRRRVRELEEEQDEAGEAAETMSG